MLAQREDIFGQNNNLQLGFDPRPYQRQPLNDLGDYTLNQPSVQAQPQNQPMSYNYRNRMNYHYNQQVQQTGLSLPFQSDISMYNEGSNTPGNHLGGYQKRGLDIKPQNPNMSVDYGAKNAKSPYKQVSFDNGISDIKSKRMREREERILKEKEELQSMQSYNPFGKGGSGAPYKDREGNIIPQRRPFSQVREPNNIVTQVQNPRIMNQGQNAYGINYEQETPQYGKPNQNQSVEYPSRPPQNNAPAKISRLESSEQMDERQRKQYAYQEILKQQIDEKKAKEEVYKRKKMEDDIREEQRLKYEIETENEIVRQEKLKIEKKQNDIINRARDMQPPSPVKNRIFQHHTQSQSSIQIEEQRQREAIPNQQQFNDFKRQFDQPKRDQQNFNNHQQQQQQQYHDSYQHQQQPIHAPQQQVFPQHSQAFNLLENNFQNELQKLKYDMQLQQQEFENQLLNLKSEAQRNVDSRLKAEQELQKMRLSSEKNQRTSSSREIGTRRGMANMNQYEKLFFNGTSQIQNESQFKSNANPNPYQQQQNQKQYGSGFNNNQSSQQITSFDNIPYSQGLGGKFDGSKSLIAESTFVPIVFDVPGLPFSSQQQQASEINHQPQLVNKEPLIKSSFQIPQQQQKTQIHEQEDVSLQYLENQLDEISQLNVGETFKETQQQLEIARLESRGDHNRPSTKQKIPEYKGIQQPYEMDDLLSQFIDVNSSIEQSQIEENEDIKNEILRRNVPPMESIMEASNEQTFPSGLNQIRS